MKDRSRLDSFMNEVLESPTPEAKGELDLHRAKSLLESGYRQEKRRPGAVHWVMDRQLTDGAIASRADIIKGREHKEHPALLMVRQGKEIYWLPITSRCSYLTDRLWPRCADSGGSPLNAPLVRLRPGCVSPLPVPSLVKAMEVHLPGDRSQLQALAAQVQAADAEPRPRKTSWLLAHNDNLRLTSSQISDRGRHMGRMNRETWGEIQAHLSREKGQGERHG